MKPPHFIAAGPPRGRTASLVLLFTILLAGLSAAQVSKVSATLEGMVVDSSGAVIPGAEVRLRNTETNQTRTVRSDERGFFRASELAVGTYEVSVEQSGFSPFRHVGIVLTVGQTARLNIELALGSATGEVTVTDQPPAIDASQTSLTTTVETERIEELPVRSRNYLNFVLLAPGVAGSTQQQTVQTRTPLADSGFTFGGLRARSNNLTIDGLDNNDEYTGASRTELSLEIVREFQVVNNGWSAEIGGASGGSINVVTKTGANIIHGDAFLFAQDGSLDARPPFVTGNRKPELSRYRVGLAVGGPLVEDRTFYYAAFEQEHTRAESNSDIDPAVASAVNQFLASGAFPHLSTRRINTDFFPTARAETEVSGKFTHQFNQQRSLMLRYAFTNNREAGDAFNTGAFTDASSRGSRFTEDHAIVGSLVTLHGTKAVSDFRFQVATRRDVLRTNDPVGPEIDVNGSINFGRPYEGNESRRENHYQFSYTLTMSPSSHLLKIGATVNRVRLGSDAPDGFGGVYLFRSLTDFFAGNADSFRQAFGIASTNFAVTSYAAFVQDHWSVTKRLTIDLGLRYDFERVPTAFNQDTNNFSPRVGLAYNFSGRWVLRAGFGIFHDRYVLAFLNRALEKDGVRAFEQVADDALAMSLFRQAAGGPLSAPMPGIRPSVFQPDPRLATAYSQQSSLSIEHLLAQNLTVSANYLFVRGMKLSRTRNVNLLQPIVLTPQNATSLGITDPAPQQIGRDVFGPDRSDPHFNDIYRLEDAASSTYHGLSLTLNRRLANEVAFSASYTVSKTLDDASDFDEQPENPFNLRAERALSRDHQGQRFVLSALFDLPFGEEEKGTKSSNRKSLIAELLDAILGHIEVAPILTLGSGRPMNPLTGFDADHSHAFPLSSRPLGLGRNTLKSGGLDTLDLRVLKFFKVGDRGKLDFVVEGFNVFNHVNINQVNTFYGVNRAPLEGFGRPVGALNARQVQFSIDFEF